MLKIYGFVPGFGNRCVIFWILRKQLFQLLRSRTFGQPKLVVQDSYGGGFESFLAAASAVFPRIVNDASHGYICVDA